MSGMLKLNFYRPRLLNMYQFLCFYIIELQEFNQKKLSFKRAFIWVLTIRDVSKGNFSKAYSRIDDVPDGLLTEKKALEFTLLKGYLELLNGYYSEGAVTLEFFYQKLKTATDVNIDEKLYLGLYAYRCCDIIRKYLYFDFNDLNEFKSKEIAIQKELVDKRIKKYFPIDKDFSINY